MQIKYWILFFLSFFLTKKKQKVKTVRLLPASHHFPENLRKEN